MAYLMSLKRVYDQVQRDLKNGVERNTYIHVPLHSLRGKIELINLNENKRLDFVFWDKDKKEYKGSIDLLSFGKLKIKKLVNEIKEQVKEGL